MIPTTSYSFDGRPGTIYTSQSTPCFTTSFIFILTRTHLLISSIALLSRGRSTVSSASAPFVSLTYHSTVTLVFSTYSLHTGRSTVSSASPPFVSLTYHSTVTLVFSTYSLHAGRSTVSSSSTIQHLLIILPSSQGRKTMHKNRNDVIC